MELGIKQIRTGITAAKETIQAAKQNFYLDINPMEVHSLPQDAIDQIHDWKPLLGSLAVRNKTFISFFDVAKEYGKASEYLGKGAEWCEGVAPDSNEVGVTIRKLGRKKPTLSFTVPYESKDQPKETFMKRLFNELQRMIEPERIETSVQDSLAKEFEDTSSRLNVYNTIKASKGEKVARDEVGHIYHLPTK